MLWRSRYNPTITSTPTLSLLCWLFRMFSYTLLIKIYLVLIIYFSIMCHHVVFSGRDFVVSINSQPIPGMTSVVTHYPYRVPPPRIRPLFYPDMYQHLARQSHHTHTNNFFSVYGIRMASQHLNLACIHGNFFTKLILYTQDRNNRNPSTISVKFLHTFCQPLQHLSWSGHSHFLLYCTKLFS